MYNKLTMVILTMVLIFAVILTGCGTNSYLLAAGNVQQDEESTADNVKVNSVEDESIKKLISEYFVKLYSESVDKYQAHSAKGSIPEPLKNFLAKRTLDEGNENIEVGLNYPRYIGLNGQTIVRYSPLMRQDVKDQPQLESTFIEESNGKLLYFVKLRLKADCLPDEVFDKRYELDDSTQTYKEITDAEPLTVEADTIHIQARYDVELEKEKDKYIIVRARESTFKQGARNRLFRYNNDFITRIPYLSLEKQEDNETYINQKDVEIYTGEKELITSFFDNLLKLDSERRALLGSSWDEGQDKFKKLVTLIGLDKASDTDKENDKANGKDEENSKAKETVKKKVEAKRELLKLDSEYKTKFPKEALILDGNIEKIETQKDGLGIELHPAYSKLKKWYIVTYIATVSKTSDPFEGQQYMYDFLVKLDGDTSDMKIESIKLNNVSAVRQTDNQQENGQAGG